MTYYLHLILAAEIGDLSSKGRVGKCFLALNLAHSSMCEMAKLSAWKHLLLKARWNLSHTNNRQRVSSS